MMVPCRFLQWHYKGRSLENRDGVRPGDGWFLIDGWREPYGQHVNYLVKLYAVMRV